MAESEKREAEMAQMGIYLQDLAFKREGSRLVVSPTPDPPMSQLGALIAVQGTLFVTSHYTSMYKNSFFH